MDTVQPIISNPRFIDETGNAYSRLTVLGFAKTVPNGQSTIAAWRCLCRCGKTIIVRGGHLRKGHTQSCGCLKRERVTASVTTHGKYRTPEYRVWKGLLSRCYAKNQPAYRNYGGRGIRACARWRKSFQNFLDDMGPRPSSHHTIERIQNDGPYSPKNCCWATRREQAQNKRSNRHITSQGQTKTITGWSRHLGGSTSCIHNRLARGWSIERAVTTPIRGLKLL